MTEQAQFFPARHLCGAYQLTWDHEASSAKVCGMSILALLARRIARIAGCLAFGFGSQFCFLSRFGGSALGFRFSFGSGPKPLCFGCDGGFPFGSRGCPPLGRSRLVGGRGGCAPRQFSFIYGRA